jgi:hypothetical protein
MGRDIEWQSTMNLCKELLKVKYRCQPNVGVVTVTKAAIFKNRCRGLYQPWHWPEDLWLDFTQVPQPLLPGDLAETIPIPGNQS